MKQTISILFLLRTTLMPPKRKHSDHKRPSPRALRAGAKKYVLEEAGEGAGEEPGTMSQREIDEIYNGIPEHEEEQYPLADAAGLEGEAVEVRMPLKKHQTTFAMVSPDKAGDPGDSNERSSSPGTAVRPEDAPDHQFVIHRPRNPYLKTTRAGSNHANAVANDGSGRAMGVEDGQGHRDEDDDDDGHEDGHNGDDDDDDDSCDSVRAFLVGQHPVQEGTPLGELAGKNQGVCYYEYLQGGMVIFTAYNGNQRPAFTLHATLAAKFRMPPFDHHVCSGVNYSIAPNSNQRLMEPGNKCYTGVVVSRTDFDSRHDLLRFFHEYIRFLNSHTYRKDDSLTLQERIWHQPNLTTYRAAMSPDMTKDPKRKLGDVVTLSDACEHLERVNPQIFNHTVYAKHRNLITRYFDPPYPRDLHEHFGFPVED